MDCCLYIPDNLSSPIRLLISASDSPCFFNSLYASCADLAPFTPILVNASLSIRD